MRMWLVAVLVLGSALAGCTAGEGSPDDQDAGVFEGLEESAEATETTGAIAGVVVDEAIRPIPGANVTLAATNTTVTADGEGRFAFEGLDPGVHFLSTTMRRYSSTQVSVDVVAGEVATARVMLTRLTSVEPYKQTVQFRGYVDNWLGFANFAVEVIAPGTLGCECAFDVPVSGNLSTLIIEATGTAQVQNPGTPATKPGDVYYEIMYGGTQGSLQASDYVEFPVFLRYGVDFVGNETVFGIRITGGVNPVVRMDYDLFVTAFYHEEAPADWSFVAGDT